MKKPKPLWRSQPFTLSLIAAVFTTVYKAMDNITVHNFIIAEDGLTAAFSYLIVGGWTGVIFGLLFSLILGKKLLDQDFNGLVIKNATMHKQAIIAGAISAGSTLFLLWGNQMGDPSMLIALGSGTILYTSIYDVATKQARAKYLALPVVLVLVGSILATFGGSLGVTLTGILLVVFLSNGLDAFSKISEQKGTRASDGVNFFLWRFFWLATTGTVMALVVSAIRGYSGMLEETVLRATRYLPFIAATMLFVFFGVGLKLVAMKKSAVSVVLIVLTAQIILGYPITLLGNFVQPGMFGEVPKDLWIWGVRIAGAALIIWSIERLRSNKEVTGTT